MAKVMAASMGVDIGGNEPGGGEKDHTFQGHSSVAALPFNVGYESMVTE